VDYCGKLLNDAEYKNNIYILYNIVIMVIYTCYRCNYTTKRKSDIRNHLIRKTLCKDCGEHIKLTKHIKSYILQGLSYLEYKEIINKNKQFINNNQNISLNNQFISLDNQFISSSNQFVSLDKVNNSNKNKCDYCGNIYTLKNNLTRHLKSCKVKDSEVEILKIKVEKLELENKRVNDKLGEYEEEVEELKYIISQKNKIIKENKSINKYTNCNTTNTNCNNTTNNIVINNYNTPNTEYLEYNIKKECIYTDYVYIIPIMKDLFFNKEHPENHSISYSNMRSNSMSVYNGNEWILQNRVDIINDIINNCDDILSEFINDIRDGDDITYKKKKMVNLYDKYISKYTLSDEDYKSLNEYIYMESKNLNIKPSTLQL